MALADASLWHINDPLEVYVARDTLLERPEWMRDGLCREYPETSFFPELGESAAGAKEICGRCIVSNECLNYALKVGSSFEGIWAGTSKRERRQLGKVISSGAA